MLFSLLLAAAAACPADQLIGLDLPAWKKSLLADKPGSDEQRADMAALRMKIVPEGNEGDAACFDKPVVEGVDLFDANLTGLRDKLVQVRFRLCKGSADEWQSLRVAVLVPQPEGKWCLLDGEDLSVDRAAKNRLCDRPGKLPMTLVLRELIEKGRNVVETVNEQGTCGEPRMEGVTAAFYQAQGWSLARVLELVLLDAHGDDARKNHTYALTFGKAFPKDVHLSRCVGSACEKEEYVWKSGKYVSK